MSKTFQIIFSLRNTYRVNSVLYSLKQIPLIKKLLPDQLYGIWGLKIFANVISVLWEIVAVFGGKFLYFLFLILLPGSLYPGSEGEIFLHLLLLLTIVGACVNTYMFDPAKDKYYAVILMQMDAWRYTMVDYGYSMAKVLVGFLPFAFLAGLEKGLAWWQCLLIPLYVAGAKIIVASRSLCSYEKNGAITNENHLEKWVWILIPLLLVASYGLPVLGLVVPVGVSSGIMLAVILFGAASARTIIRFSDYRSMYQQILANSMIQMDRAKTQLGTADQKYITMTKTAADRKRGFEYLNALFIARHQKILWKASEKITLVILGLILVMSVVVRVFPQAGEATNRLMLTYLPYFVFIMYAVNRGTGFTRALFMNCDRSLLTYSFYKQPGPILKLFQIRLREIVKINLLPASVIGAGLVWLLYLSGGTEHWVNYAVLFISIICMSVFFSVHYLTIYYLLQPYNAGTQMKSATYQIVLSATYLVCFAFMQVRMPTLLFGGMTIVFCILYSVIACVLVYYLAPRTFRLRN